MILSAIVALVTCLGYNIWYFDLTLPNGSVGQILDILDYVSNYVLMPIVALVTCILVGWIVKPKAVIDEVKANIANIEAELAEVQAQMKKYMEELGL